MVEDEPFLKYTNSYKILIYTSFLKYVVENDVKDGPSTHAT